MRIFQGEKSPAREAVLLNAAVALAAYKGEFEKSINEQLAQGYAAVSAAVDSGAANETLANLAAFTQGLKSA